MGDKRNRGGETEAETSGWEEGGDRNEGRGTALLRGRGEEGKRVCGWVGGWGGAETEAETSCKFGSASGPPIPPSLSCLSSSSSSADL